MVAEEVKKDLVESVHRGIAKVDWRLMMVIGIGLLAMANLFEYFKQRKGLTPPPK